MNEWFIIFSVCKHNSSFPIHPFTNIYSFSSKRRKSFLSLSLFGFLFIFVCFFYYFFFFLKFFCYFSINFCFSFSLLVFLNNSVLLSALIVFNCKDVVVFVFVIFLLFFYFSFCGKHWIEVQKFMQHLVSITWCVIRRECLFFINAN